MAVNFLCTEESDINRIKRLLLIFLILTLSSGIGAAAEIQVNSVDSIQATVSTANPVANFNANPTSGYAPLSVQFNDSSENATSVNWDFGDGNTSTDKDPTHIYSSAGNYTVVLTVINANGMNSTFAAITVLQPVLPVANFSSSVTSGTAPLNVQFTDLSLNSEKWSWDFGDGANSTERNPTHIYSSAGNYTVVLTVNNENGSNSKTLKIIVQKDVILPVANFNVNPTSGYAPLYVQFTDLSQNANQWNWDFGDRATSTAQNPVHTYSAAGNYTATLTVINANGMNSTFAAITVLQPVLPVANFSSSVTSGTAPLNVQFTDFSLNSEKWSWDFGDGANSTERNPTHIYSLAGNYTVVLTVNNENGSNSKTLKIIVQKDVILPVANFNVNPTSGYAPLSVQFTDLSQYAISRSWDFGDGANSTEQNPTHIYSAAGTYTVSLTAINENGTSPTKPATITVTQQSSSSDGSSGGGSHSSGSSGGGGGSPEPAKNVEVKELSQAFITSGKPVQFDFTKNATCIVYVSFDAKRTFGKTTTIAEMLKGKSSLVSELPSGEVYKSFNIWVGNGGIATSKNIEKPVVCFKVEKAWVQDKKINQASITLNRYSDKKWEQLPVSLSGEDDKFLYFTSETSGFSSFAVTGKAKKSSEETGIEIQPESNTGTINKNNTVNKEPQTEQKKIPSKPGFEIYCGVAGLLAVFLYFTLFLYKWE